MSQSQPRLGPDPSFRGKGGNVALERWLQVHLRQLYEEVCREPMPDDLTEVIERFRAKRQDCPLASGATEGMTAQARRC